MHAERSVQATRMFASSAGPADMLEACTVQVSSLIWNPYDKELLGGLGESQNQLRMWRWPSCNHVTDLFGHEARVLHMALSPDGCTVCRCDATASHDTLMPRHMLQRSNIVSACLQCGSR